MICIVIVNWRGYEDTIECIESLTRMDGPDVRVLVVDNESDPAGVAAIADWAAGRRAASTFGPAWRKLPGPRRREPGMNVAQDEPFRCATAPLVTVFPLADNRGFAAAGNVGLHAALADRDCTHVWLLNNDTIVDGQALAELVARMAQETRGGCCGSTLLYYDAPTVVQCLGGTYSRLRGRSASMGQGGPASELPPRAAVELRLDYVTGASMFLTRSFVETVGPMHEGYFLYFEELDWSRRNRGRFAMCWAPNSRVYHKEGRSIGTNSRARPSDTSLYYHNASYLRFTLRHDTLLAPLALGIVALKALVARAKGDRAASNVLRMALVDVLTGRHRVGKIERRENDAGIRPPGSP